ncbi:cytochrome-b5 reductase [Malassezia obtusa]|uniref:NADH-cytochrome b5 reductase n=1 Tax=Malassezia obtusa TaxID=76774 RepID=A0AAF0IU47_9BASI|nr:cytochrome-b5 reductase [Malassezia obtusa]
MHPDQLLLVLSTVATFIVCCFVAHCISSYFADTHWILRDYSQATSFMDYRVVGTFVAGLVLSVALLYFFTCSKPEPLSKDEWRKFTLIEKIPVSKSSAIYRFQLPRGRTLGLPIGQHLSVRAKIGERFVMRSYTPVSDPDATGHFDLLVKTYPTGNLSRIFGELKIGDQLEMKGPKGQFNYRRNMASTMGMIAGGTGLTPCLQVLEQALRDPLDTTRFSLIYANVDLDEILLKERLDALAARHPDRFQVHYFLNNAPPNWSGGVGFVTRDAIDTHLPRTSDTNRLLMCGPPPMITAMKGHLAQLKFPPPRAISQEHDPVFIF